MPLQKNRYYAFMTHPLHNKPMLKSLTIDTTTIIEAIPHPVMVIDTAGRIIGGNLLLEALTGYNCQNVLGIHGELVLRTNTGNTTGLLFKQVTQEGKPVSVSGDMINGHRRKIPIQYTVSPLFTTLEKSVCALLIIIEDLSAYQTQEDNLTQHGSSYGIIGYSTKMQAVLDLIPLMSQTDASVMITGETGTGKDKIAELIHNNSPRARFPFIKINCGALPSELLESELFGHVKGAFTGATRDKSGMFKLADRGTLFLTEIGDMPLSLQVKLLSVLDDKEFIPVGGEKKTSVDVRIIAATHRPLREQIRQNLFREDLFYRLHVLHVHLPPLRERDDDIRSLLEHFLKNFSQALGRTIVGFTSDALEHLLNYQYPGNIRELKNIVEYSVNVCPKKHIDLEHLPLYVNEIENVPQTDQLDHRRHTIVPGNQETPQPTQHSNMSWEEIEREMIIATLKKHGGNRTKSSVDLGWGRMKLWRKMKLYNLLK